MRAQTANTTPVRRLVSAFVGQLTFFISRPTSVINPLNPRLERGKGTEPVGILLPSLPPVLLAIDVKVRLPKQWGIPHITPRYGARKQYELHFMFAAVGFLAQLVCIKT